MKIAQSLFFISLVFFVSNLLLAESKIVFKNFSHKKVWVAITKKGPLRVDSSVKDYSGFVEPGTFLTQTAPQMPRIYVLPWDEAQYGKKSDDVRKSIADNLNLKQTLGEDRTSYLSFDIDKDGNQHLYFGHFPVDQKFSVLEFSDIHVDEPNLEKPIEKTVSLMQHYIGDLSKNVQGVIIVGDVAGYGNRETTKLFKKLVFTPLDDSLKKQNSHIFLTLGNHDTYWEKPLSEGTVMMDFIKKVNGALMYKFKIGRIQFINLGLYPAEGKKQVDSSGSLYIETNEPSLDFLKNTLAKVGPSQPVVIMHHFPIHGFMSDWWTKKEKDMYFEAIKNYNVLAIIVGHAHGASLFKFRDKFTVLKCGSKSEFASLVFDYPNNKEVDITIIDQDNKERILNFTKAEERERTDLQMIIDTEKISQIVKTSGLNFQDSNGNTPLLLALDKALLKLAKELIDQGADVNVVNKDKNSALMLASQKNAKDIAKALLGKRAHVDLANKDGWTSLMFAAKNDARDVAKILLDTGADVNAKNNKQETALTIAKNKKNSEIQSMIEKKGGTE